MNFCRGPMATFLEDLDELPTYTLKPFTPSEAQLFISLHANQLSNSTSWMDEIYSLTNYNPLLLTCCIQSKDVASAKIRVLKKVRKRVEELKKTVRDEYEWVEETMSTSIEMLYNAANSFSVANTKKEEYECCWLASEGVIYIANETDDVFEPRVNFPPIVPLLTEMLKQVTLELKVPSPLGRRWWLEDGLRVACACHLMSTKSAWSSSNYSLFHVWLRTCSCWSVENYIIIGCDIVVIFKFQYDQ